VNSLFNTVSSLFILSLVLLILSIFFGTLPYYSAVVMKYVANILVCNCALNRSVLLQLMVVPSTDIPNYLDASLVSLSVPLTRSANQFNSCWQFQTNEHNADSRVWTISYLHTTLRKKIFYCYLPFVEWSVLGTLQILSRRCLRFYLQCPRMPSQKEQHCILSYVETEIDLFWA
jgi:hypothetical protein